MKSKLTFQHSIISLNMQKTLPLLGMIVISASVSANPHSTSAELPIEHSQQIQQDNDIPAHLPPELQNTQKWQAFKILWQQLNTIAQPHEGTRAPDEHHYIEVTPNLCRSDRDFHTLVPWKAKTYNKREYYQALSSEQARIMHAQLHEIFSESSLSLEAQLLARLTELRIQEMSLTQRFADFKLQEPDEDEAFLAATSRMTPVKTICLTSVSPTIYLVNAIDRIQMRAQTLIELRKKNSVSDKIYHRTLDALIRDAQQALFLDTLKTTSHSEDSPESHDFQVKLSIPMPKNLISMIRSYYLIGTIEPEDVVQPNTPKQIKQTDMQSLSVWERAARSSYKRKLNTFVLQPQNRKAQYMPVKDKQDALFSLTQQLKNLRKTLVDIEPLIAELER